MQRTGRVMAAGAAARLWGIAILTATILGGLGLSASPAYAQSVTVPPGTEFTLSADIVLGDGDSFTATDAAGGARCKIHGAGRSIRTDSSSWGGTLTIRNCDVDGLGTSASASLDIQGTGNVTVEGNTFATSGAFNFILAGAMNLAFVGNRIEANSVAVADPSLLLSQPAVNAVGNSTGTKVFKGNRILKSFLHLEATSGWTIGGPGPNDGNVFVGIRAGIVLDRVTGLHIIGNYIRVQVVDDSWNSVKNLSMTSALDTIIEHNVLRAGAWLVEPGNSPVDFRYNLVSTPLERAWLQVRAPAGAKLHHNVLVRTKDFATNQAFGGFEVILGDDLPPSTEIYNNTLDSGGVCNAGIYAAVTLEFAPLASLRSNAFTNVRINSQGGGPLVGLKTQEVMSPLPALLGYTDYNLWHNLDRTVSMVYGVGVEGKTMRADPGAGYNDVPRGGAANAQVDPQFIGDPLGAGGKFPRNFPFRDEDVIAGTTKVAQILAYYRKVYSPAPGSPLIDAGDPLEGAGNDIGAIGAGTPNALDKFGTLGDPNDIGNPLRTADYFTCSEVCATNNCPGGGTGGGGTGGGGSGTGGTGPMVGQRGGVTCVCTAGAAAGGPGLEGALLALGAGLGMVARRRARRGRQPRR